MGDGLVKISIQQLFVIPARAGVTKKTFKNPS